MPGAVQSVWVPFPPAWLLTRQSYSLGEAHRRGSSLTDDEALRGRSSGKTALDLLLLCGTLLGEIIPTTLGWSYVKGPPPKKTPTTPTTQTKTPPVLILTLFPKTFPGCLTCPGSALS